MELPKIPKAQLTPSLREIVGDQDLEFDSIVDPMDVMDIKFDANAYRADRIDIGKKIMELRTHGRITKESKQESSQETNKDVEETS
tara:strand:+ start:931 stop:1188 length:258 start_codon:yes stop_codon:yes gene_type:complete